MYLLHDITFFAKLSAICYNCIMTDEISSVPRPDSFTGQYRADLIADYTGSGVPIDKAVFLVDKGSFGQKLERASRLREHLREQGRLVRDVAHIALIGTE